MAPADALSRKDLVDISNDDTTSSICPDTKISSPTVAAPLHECLPLVDVLVQTLDLQIMECIKSSSTSNPLIAQALQDLEKGNPLFPRSSLTNWKFEDGTLYYKGCMYVPHDIRQSLITALHESLTLRHTSCFQTKTFIE